MFFQALIYSSDQDNEIPAIRASCHYPHALTLTPRKMVTLPSWWSAGLVTWRGRMWQRGLEKRSGYLDGGVIGSILIPVLVIPR